MAKKLWGGRFGKKTHPLAEEFTKSISFDYKLFDYDIAGTLQHVNILKKRASFRLKRLQGFLGA